MLTFFLAETYESLGINNPPFEFVSSAPRSSSATQPSVSPAPAPAVTVAPTPTKPGSSGIPRAPSQSSQQRPVPKGPKGKQPASRFGWVRKDVDPLHGPVMQHTSNAARAGPSSQPKKHGQRRESDCKNKDAKGSFVFCPCYYCRFQAHCVFVGTCDRDVDAFSAEDYGTVAAFLGQWGQVEAIFVKGPRSLLVR